MSQRNTEAPRVVYEGKYQRMVVRGSWEYSERTHAGGDEPALSTPVALRPTP